MPSCYRTLQALGGSHVIHPFRGDGVSLARIVRARAIPFRMLSRWVKLYREMGLKGLTLKGRSDKGERGVCLLMALSK